MASATDVKREEMKEKPQEKLTNLTNTRYKTGTVSWLISILEKLSRDAKIGVLSGSENIPNLDSWMTKEEQNEFIKFRGWDNIEEFREYNMYDLGSVFYNKDKNEVGLL